MIATLRSMGACSCGIVRRRIAVGSPFGKAGRARAALPSPAVAASQALGGAGVARVEDIAGQTGGLRTETLGQRLRAARESAGLSLADVSARTKVRPGLLAAFEADDHSRLPALTYATGFVKAFARTVGLDPDDAAERYRRESGAQAPVPQEASLQPLDERRLPSSRTVAAATAAVVLAVGGLWAWGAGWFDRPADAPAAVMSPSTAATPQPSAARPSVAAPAPSPTAPVILTATDDVWLRVYDRQSNRTAFQGTLPKGQAYTVPPAEAGWLLRTGRAGALAVTVAGRPIPPLGGPVDSVKHVPLDPQSLIARAAPPAAQA